MFKIVIKGRLRRLGIRKQKLKLGDKLYDDKDWLYEQYIIKKKGYTVIANELGVSYTTILDRILFFGWPLRGHRDIDKGLPRRGLKHSAKSIQKIKNSRIKNRIPVICTNCEKRTEKTYSAFIKNQNSFCCYECYKEYLKKNRVETEDITDSAEYKEWRKKVYVRDNYRCKMPGCSSNSKQIAAHHIYPKRKFPEKKFDVSNGITLCKKCHEKTFGKESNYIDALVRVVQTMND
ncbi:MAG TPA: HNH endonuclease signature motif containing protein [Bacillales bacterium]|nr:HNH endonuclease signature motif containing protein [Bacillales bacterium]